VIIALALLCSSIIETNASVNIFIPSNLDETACTGTVSWTRWFNTGRPNDNDGKDEERLSKIQSLYGHDVCTTPVGIHAQSVSDISSGKELIYTWSTENEVLASFTSLADGVDYQVRFCCPNDAFNPTTTTTTTQRPLTCRTCGRPQIQHSLKSSRIFGGSHAIPNSWPWQVLYQVNVSCGDNQFCFPLCGGTLIDSRHVLTAAHCVLRNDPSAIIITAGLHNKNNEENESRQVRQVEQIFKHPDYNPTTHQNDLTILRLAEPVDFNRYVQPACLPGPEPQPNEDVVLIGWGTSELNGDSNHELKQTKVKVVGECNKYWGSSINEDKQVCVAHPTDGDSACQGDSGGPMLYQRNGQWIVSGVASFVSATGCRTDGNTPPNVYVRVSAYLPWINSIV